jgi:hypothetical protein
MVFVLFFALVPFLRAEAAICSAGDKVQVLWKGTWYPATVLQAKGDQCFIHYDGYDSSWDEWVGSDRIRVTSSKSSAPSGGSSLSEGDPVKVLWKGAWYPAHVLRVKGDRLYIHYDGYDSSWDEWVGRDRYKR